MAKSRAEKEAALQEYKDQIVASETVVLTHNKGMTVAQVTELRNRLRENGGKFKVMKNTLAKMAVKDTQFEGLRDKFEGPVGVASSQDPVAAAKIVHEFVKESNERLVIVGGAMGAKILDDKGVEALAKMPSLDELRSKIAGILVVPAQRLATVTQAPATQLARVMQAKADKGE